MKIGRRQALVGGALIVGGCGKTHREGYASDVDAGTDAGSPYGSPGISPSQPIDAGGPCEIDPFYARDRVVHARPAASVFYSWTTTEQAADLRKNKVLFTQTERPGLGPGYAMDRFAEIAKGSGQDAQVAAVLAGPTFAKARYAWTSAWATRMGWPGESYGNQLLRIELRPEAYTVLFIGGSFFACDASNKSVDIKTVLASPERIGAIYFVKDDVVQPCWEGHDAGPLYQDFSSFRTCVAGIGYREYILGNEKMVAEWSLATEATRAEIDRGRTFVIGLNGRLPMAAASDPLWNARAVEHWRTRYPLCDETNLYFDSLAIPSPLYEPTGGNIEAIADTLAGDLFTPDPLVVRL